MKLCHHRGQKGHGFAGPGTEQEKPLETLTFRGRKICVSSLQNPGPCKSRNKDLILSAQCYSSLRLWGGGGAYGEAVQWVNATCVTQLGPTGRKAIVELYGIYHETHTFVQLEWFLSSENMKKGSCWHERWPWRELDLSVNGSSHMGHWSKLPNFQATALSCLGWEKAPQEYPLQAWVCVCSSLRAVTQKLLWIWCHLSGR